MPKSSKKVEEVKKLAQEASDDEFGDDEETVAVKKAKLNEAAQLVAQARAEVAEARATVNATTSLVKAASTAATAVGPVCSVNEGKKRMNKLFGSSNMKAEVNPMGNTKKNYVVVKGVLVASGSQTHQSKKAGKDGKTVSFTKYLISIAAQSIKPISSASLCYGGSVDDPACNYAIANKIVHKEGKQDKEADHRYAPEQPRFTHLSCRDYTTEKKEDKEKNAWYSKAQVGSIVEVTLELKIKKGDDVQTGYTDMHAVSVHPRAPVDTSECNAAGAALKTLFSDSTINLTNYDSIIDMCGGMNAFRYGTDAENAKYLDPSCLVDEDEDALAKRAELMKSEHFDKLATAEFNLRMEKRKATLCKEIKRNTNNFPEGTDPAAKPAYITFADNLLLDKEYKPLHELLELSDKEVQGLYILSSNNMRPMQLFSDTSQLPKRFCDAIPQHVEIAGNKAFVAIQFSFVLCPNSAAVVKHLADDADGTFLLRSQKSVHEEEAQSRLTIKADMTRMANAFGTRSTAHLVTVVNTLVPKAQMFFKTSIKNPAPVSNGTGALDDRYIEAMIIDVPGVLKHAGIPVSSEWVKTNLCKGIDMFNGLKHVDKNDKELITDMMGDYKNNGEIITDITERAFINLTEYKGASVGEDSPFYNAPMDNPVRMVVVMDHPELSEWYEELREGENLSPYDMASNGQGEAFLDRLFDADNKDAKKGEHLDSIGEFLLKHNASVFAVLEGKSATTIAMDVA